MTARDGTIIRPLGGDEREEWIRDCMRWRGRVLEGDRAHWCFDWDGLPVDETTDENDACHCRIVGVDPEPGAHSLLVERQSDDELERKARKAARAQGIYTQEEIDAAARKGKRVCEDIAWD